MATDKGRVEVKVATDVEMSEVDALEKRLAQIKRNKIQLMIDAKTEQIEQARERIDYLKKTIAGLEAVPPHLGITIDDEQVEKLKSELASLEGKTAQLQLDVEKGELEQAKSEINELDGKEINLQLATANIMAGLQTVKQSVGELKQNMDEVAQAGMQSEQNKAFLEMNLGAEKARDTYQQISDIVASMPGDDNTMRSVLSTAQALGNNLKPDEMKSASATMADYMSASATMGKMATESQQDIMKYLLDGNTAELERGSIVSSQVDKLKEADTFMERQQAMQQVLNELGYGGLSQQDTMLNKQAEWEGMIYNSQDALSSMWLNAEKGAMDYVLQLNDASNGMVGIGIVAGQMVGGPMFDAITGIGQMAVAYNALKEAKVVQTIANWGLTISEWAVASPMLIIVALIAVIIGLLILLYMNSEEVRNAIDSLGQSLLDLGSYIVDSVIGAFNYIDQVLTDSLNSFNNWGNNLINTIVNTARNAVNGFTSWIGGMYNALVNELNNMLSAVGNWASQLWNRFKNAGINAVKSFLAGLGIASPGTMQRTLIWEIQSMGERVPEESRGLIKNIGSLGSDVVDEFGSPSLDMSYSLNNTLSSNAGNNTGAFRDINITVEGDVDSEDRIQQIVDAVTRSLAFENTTAGRSV